jgi:hypothetical protein
VHDRTFDIVADVFEFGELVIYLPGSGDFILRALQLAKKFASLTVVEHVLLCQQNSIQRHGNSIRKLKYVPAGACIPIG